MKIFMDTANVDEIREFADMGIVYGVTTNPSLIAKSGRSITSSNNSEATFTSLSFSTALLTDDSAVP